RARCCWRGSPRTRSRRSPGRSGGARSTRPSCPGTSRDTRCCRRGWSAGNRSSTCSPSPIRATASSASMPGWRTSTSGNCACSRRRPEMPAPAMWEFLRFEWREQMRSGLLWMFALFFGLLAFGAMSSEAVQIGGAAGGVYKNAPTVVITILAMFTLIGLLAIAGIVSHALLGDFELGTADLVFSHPIRKRDYLVGRMLAAFLACVVVFLVIAGAMLLAQHMPWIDPERLGPTPWRAYAWALGVIVLPNLVFALGLLGLLAVLTRSILWVYIGLLGYIVGRSEE